mgnify:CR=1 FL=1
MSDRKQDQLMLDLRDVHIWDLSSFIFSYAVCPKEHLTHAACRRSLLPLTLS